MNKAKKLLLPVFLLLIGIIAVPQPAAASSSPLTQFAGCSGTSFFGFPSWDACLPKQDGQPVIKSLDDIWKIAFPLIESMIKAAGYLSVIFIVWGGVKYIKSQGDPGQISAAQKTLINAITGLMIAILSVALVQFVSQRL